MYPKIIIDNQFVAAAWSLIMSATSTINLSFYKAELPVPLKKKKLNIIYQALFFKRKEGVSVRVLLNKEQPLKGVSRYNTVVASFLKENNIPCKFLAASRCCHAKLIIVDKFRFYVGSHNLSNNAVSRNFEAGIIIDNGLLGLELNSRFDYLWDSAADFF